ncbi:MAG: hypothetical protein ACKO37_00225 [Vampirovibrionales bacterium]
MNFQTGSLFEPLRVVTTCQKRHHSTLESDSILSKVLFLKPYFWNIGKRNMFKRRRVYGLKKLRYLLIAWFLVESRLN